MPTCSDLRLGGTLSATGIAGGTSINDYALSISDWSSILGSPGMSGGTVQVTGRPGGYVAGDRLGLPRFPTLNMTITDLNHTGGLTAPTSPEQKQDNTDEFLALVTAPNGNYLEVDMPDATSRFIYVYGFSPAAMRQPRRQRSISVPLESPMTFWKEGGNQSTDTISGADTLVNGGNREVYDAVLVFASDGTFTHSGLGWDLTITGSTGAVTVDLGARTVTMGGNPADNLLTRTDRKWGWFLPGNNSVTSTVSVGVTWRSSWA
jgi:hypothetical protein